MLTVKQAATRANVSVSLIYILLKKRQLPAIRVGCRGRGKWLIKEDALDAFLTKCAVAALPPENEGELKHIR